MTLKAGDVKIILTADAASYSAAMEKARRQITQFAGAATSAGKAGADAGRAMVAPWQASSAALRVAEGNMTNNIRAAERFLATIPGVGKALQAAFPVVGAIALAGVFARMGEEVYKFIQRVNEVPKALEQGFREQHVSGQLAIDELQKQNDLLDNQIAKLQGKRQNNLKIELDEAAIAADKLEQSLMHDNKQISDLLKAQQISWVGSIASGKDTTSGVSDAVSDWNQKLVDRMNDLMIAQHQYGPNAPQTQRAQAAYDQTHSQAEAAMRMQIFARQDDATPDVLAARVANGIRVTGGNQSVNRGIASAELAQLYQQDSVARLTAGHEQKEDAFKTGSELAEARKKMLEQTTRTVAELTSMHREVDAQIEEYGRTPGQISPIPLVGMYGQTGSVARGATMQAESLNPGNRDQDKAVLDYLKNLNASIELQRKNAAAVAEASLRVAVMTGELSKHGEAQALAAMHTQDYVAAMERLDEAARKVEGASWLSYTEKQAQLSGIANQRSGVIGAYSVQQMQDEETIRAASNLGEFADNLEKTANELTDWGAKIGELFDRTLGDVNKDVIDSLTMRHPRVGWGNTGSEFFRGVAGIGLQSGEGQLMKALGFGGGKKPTGAAGDPLHVVMASGPGGGMSSLFTPGSPLAKLAGLLGFGGGKVASSGGANGDISAISSLMTALPMMASGGAISSNMPAIVGERGPELFLPSSSGRIVPNEALGGGDVHHHWEIDARGATDPAAVDAAVRRGIAQAVPGIVNASVNAARDRTNRRVMG